MNRVPQSGSGVLGSDAAPVGFYQSLADGQTQADAYARPVPAPGVLPEQVRQLLGRHTLAFVCYRNSDV